MLNKPRFIGLVFILLLGTSTVGANICPDIGPPGKLVWEIGNRTLGTSCHYHPNGKLHEEISYKDKMWHGMKKKFWPSGERWHEGMYDNSKHVGIHYAWHRNGKHQIICNYNEAGRLDGKYESFSPNGNLFRCWKYSNGNKMGSCK